MSISNLSNHTITIQTRTRSQDSSGGISSGGWTNTTTGYRCTVQPASGNLVESLAKRSIVATHVAYSDTPPTLNVGDRVLFNSGYYTVQDWTDQAGRGRVFAIYLLQTKV